jgi:hypothetical protein
MDARLVIVAATLGGLALFVGAVVALTWLIQSARAADDAGARQEAWDDMCGILDGFFVENGNG